MLDFNINLPLELMYVLLFWVSQNIISVTGLLILLYILLKYAYDKKRANAFFIGSISYPPPASRSVNWDIIRFGVKWEGITEQQDPLLGSSKGAWARGPFCPSCKRSLKYSFKKIFGLPIYSRWICPGCQMRYKRPNMDEIDIIEDIEDGLESKAFRQ